MGYEFVVSSRVLFFNGIVSLPPWRIFIGIVEQTEGYASGSPFPPKPHPVCYPFGRVVFGRENTIFLT
jgi:hypothetical protein